MLPVGENYKQGKKKNPPWPLCKNAEDTQKHILVCPNLNCGTVSTDNNLSYDDLFDKTDTKKKASNKKKNSESTIK